MAKKRHEGRPLVEPSGRAQVAPACVDRLDSGTLGRKAPRIHAHATSRKGRCANSPCSWRALLFTRWGRPPPSQVVRGPSREALGAFRTPPRLPLQIQECESESSNASPNAQGEPQAAKMLLKRGEVLAQGVQLLLLRQPPALGQVEERWGQGGLRRLVLHASLLQRQPRAQRSEDADRAARGVRGARCRAHRPIAEEGDADAGGHCEADEPGRQREGREHGEDVDGALRLLLRAPANLLLRRAPLRGRPDDEPGPHEERGALSCGDPAIHEAGLKLCLVVVVDKRLGDKRREGQERELRLRGRCALRPPEAGQRGRRRERRRDAVVGDPHGLPIPTAARLRRRAHRARQRGDAADEGRKDGGADRWRRHGLGAVGDARRDDANAEDHVVDDGVHGA
mmetsp:Transcript_30759/g.87806  ORF Transcript_30759/g.87806 Transcript_30759/m.87806 type:complete len:397 (+) Transcript_30759:146-1336(+)